jgi:hypothetical protein
VIGIKLKLAFLVLVALAAAPQSFAQELAPASYDLEPNGPVKQINWNRNYVVINGRNVGSEVVNIFQDFFDRKKRLVEQIVFGEGSVKTTYKFTGKETTAAVKYYDKTGAELDDPSKFRTRFEWIVETGLCPTYSARAETDEMAKVSRTYETCTDGTRRSVTVNELDQQGRLIRSTRTDAMGRSWNAAFDLDSAGHLLEYRFRNLQSGITYTTRYSDPKYDHMKNWVRLTATTFVSTRPYEIRFQFNEVREIIYYPPEKGPAAKTSP